MSEFEQGLANIMGSFIQTELDCVEKQNQEIEQLQKENQQLKEVIEEVREYVTNHSLYEEEYDYDYEENSYLSGIDDETATKDILQILDKGVKDE